MSFIVRRNETFRSLVGVIVGAINPSVGTREVCEDVIVFRNPVIPFFVSLFDSS